MADTQASSSGFLLTYNAGSVTTAEVSVSIGQRTGAVGASLISAIALTAGVPGLEHG